MRMQPVRKSSVTRQRNGFALLVVFLMAAMVAITLYYEIPRVAFESQRNREELLVERGEQYKRAIELYYRKTKTYPQKIEDLENTNNFRFLRKRYKDPLTGKDEWRIVHMGPAGLTDSLVEKMPGLDGTKKDDKDKKEVAALDSSGQPIKGPDDVAASSNRADRDARALNAQRGSGGGAGGVSGFDPADPNSVAAAAVDPNEAFQKQQLAEYARQQALQQQQQGGGNPANNPAGQPVDPNNPGAPPISNMNLGNNGQPQPPNPFQQQPGGFPVQNNNQPFPPVGAPNGPVRTLYNNSPQLPFNPGNAMMRGAIPNPAGNVSNSQNGGFGQPYTGQPQPPQQSSSFGGGGGFGGAGGGNSSFNVPQAVRDQLTRPSGRPQMGTAQAQQFGGNGIAGIASNAPGTGIKRYNERSKYKEWEFVFDYRKPAKGAQKGMTGVGGLKTTDGTNNSPFGTNPGSQQQQGGFGNSGGFGSGMSGSGSSGGFGNPRRP